MSANWERFVWSLLAACAIAAIAMTAVHDAYASPADVHGDNGERGKLAR